MLSGGGKNGDRRINDPDLQYAMDLANQLHQTDMQRRKGIEQWAATRGDRETLARFDNSIPESEQKEKIDEILSDPIRRGYLLELRRFFDRDETKSTLREFQRLSKDKGMQSLIKEFEELYEAEENIERMRKLDVQLTQSYTIEAVRGIKELLNNLNGTFEDLNNCRQRVEQMIVQQQAKRRSQLDYQNKLLEDWMQSQDPLSLEEERIIEEANEALHAISNPYLENATHLEIAALVKANRNCLLPERIATHLIMQRIPSIKGKWELEYIEKNGQRRRANAEEQQANVLIFFEKHMPGALQVYYGAFADRIGGIKEEIEEHTRSKEELLQSIQLNDKYETLAETIKVLEKTKRDCQDDQQALPKEIEAAKQALLTANESDEKEAKEVALKNLQQLQEKRDKLNKQVQENEKKLNLIKIEKEAILSKMTPEERKNKIERENEEKKMKIEAMEVDIQKGDNLAITMKYKEIQLEIDELQKRKNHYENVQKEKVEVQKAWDAAEYDPTHENKKGLKEWLHSLKEEEAALAIGEREWTEKLPILLAKRAEILERIALSPEVEGEPFDIVNLKKKIRSLDEESETLSHEMLSEANKASSVGSKERINTIEIERRKCLEEVGLVIAGPRKRYRPIVITPSIEERFKRFLEEHEKKGLRGAGSIGLEDNLGVDLLRLVAGVVPRETKYMGVVSKTPETLLKMFKHLLDLEKIVSDVHREFTASLQESGEASSVEIDLDKIFKKAEEIKKEMQIKPTYSYVRADEVTSEEVNFFFKEMETHISRAVHFLSPYVRPADIKAAGLDLQRLALDKSQLRQKGTSRSLSNYKWAVSEVKKKDPTIVIDPDRMHEEAKAYLRKTATQKLRSIDYAKGKLPGIQFDVESALARGEIPLLVREENRKEAEEIIAAQRERELAEEEARRQKGMLLECLKRDVVTYGVGTTNNEQVFHARRDVLYQFRTFQGQPPQDADDQPSTSLTVAKKKAVLHA